MSKKLLLAGLFLLMLAGLLIQSDSLGLGGRTGAEPPYQTGTSTNRVESGMLSGGENQGRVSPADENQGGKQPIGGSQGGKQPIDGYEGDAQPDGEDANSGAVTGGLSIPYRYYHEASFHEAVSSAVAYQGNTDGLRGGVVPHHLLASGMIASFWKTVSPGGYDVIVVFGPDHQRKGTSSITTVTIPFATRWGDVRIAGSAAERLIQENIASEDVFIMEQDHAVSCQMPFIKYYLPDTPVLPILLYGNCSREDLARLSRCLQEELSGKKVLYVASMDFSHYLSLEEAQQKDLVTEEAFRSLDLDAIARMNNDYLDSRPSAQLLMMTMADLGASALVRWDHSNSDLISNSRTGRTTSYFTFGFFEEEPSQEEGQGQGQAKGQGQETILPGEKPSKKVKLAAVGDIMLGRDVESRLTSLGYDYYKPFEQVAGYLGEGDIVFGNLEHPLTDREKSLDRNRKYILRGRPDAVAGLQRAGFNLLSLANNHIMDYYGEGLDDTMALLQSHGIAYAGAGKNLAEARSPAILEKNGLKIGFLAYTDMAGILYEGNPSIRFAAEDRSPGVASTKPEWMLEDIRKARDDVDLLIVSLHWGVEDSFEVTKEQQRLARRLVDEGADVILGHHPHRFQGLELYKGKPIVYSLGNFLFDQPAPESKEAFIVEMAFSEGLCTSMEAIPVRCEDKQRVVPQTGAMADDMLNRQIRLCETLQTRCKRAGDRLVFEIPTDQ